jgi:prefoldin subunit 5
MVHTTAEIDCASGIVHLWLGANVMLEYTYDEAIELLKSKFSKAKKDLAETKEDLAVIRNQIITSEVNISRIYNWDVRVKRKERIEADKAKAVSN